jgi:hypothetical protein
MDVEAQPDEERWFTLSDASFPYYYRELMIELARFLTGLKLSMFVIEKR